MKKQIATVQEYLDSLSSDRRKEVDAVRKVIRRHVPKGIKEGIQYGMIGYFIPHKAYPAGYHCDPKQPLPFCALAERKNAMSLHLMFLYWNVAQEERFKKAWIATGRKLDMGRCCVRFKAASDAALDALAELLDGVELSAFIESYESAVKKTRKSTGKSTASKEARKSSVRTLKSRRSKA